MKNERYCISSVGAVERSLQRWRLVLGSCVVLLLWWNALAQEPPCTCENGISCWQDSLSSNPDVGFDFGWGDQPQGFWDVNGDGRDDYCRAVGKDPAFLSCALATDNGFTSDKTGPGTMVSDPKSAFDFGWKDQPRGFFDVNGDGRADYCRAVGNDPAFLSCALATDNGFPVEKTGAGTVTSDPNKKFDFGWEDQPRGFFDVNGDGRADYCRAVGNEPAFLSCALATDAGFTTDTKGVGAFTSDPNKQFDFGWSGWPRGYYDVNGDGRVDFCRAVGPDGSQYLSCALAGEGPDGFPNALNESRATYFSDPGFDFGYSDDWRGFADVNGDKNLDFCRAVKGFQDNRFLTCALSSPETQRFTNNKSGFGVYSSDPNKKFDFGWDNRPRGYFDVNGDGRADYCRAVGSDPIFLSCALASKTLEGFTNNKTGRHTVTSDPDKSFDFGYATNWRGFYDVNDDGLPDYCRSMKSGGPVYLNCALDAHPLCAEK